MTTRQSASPVTMILPSLRISGGIGEALRMARDLRARGVDVRVLSMWKHEHEQSTDGLTVEYLSQLPPRRSRALLDLVKLLVLYVWWASRQSSSKGRLVIMLTHFSTFAFAWLTPNAEVYCFNQDVEWMFVAAGWKRRLLRSFILATSRRGKVVTTNSYVDSLYRRESIVPIGEAAIWADAFWLSSGNSTRNIDVVMLLRRGVMKRLDLHLQVLKMLSERSSLRCAVITPELEIYEQIQPIAKERFLRPSQQQMQAIFQRSRVFVLLSDTEGFALPPLEAMGCGCVPVCRNSGGPRCYMTGEFSEFLLPFELNASEMTQHIENLLRDTDRLAALSLAAQEHFARGLTASQQTRHLTLDRLAEALLSP